MFKPGWHHHEWTKRIAVLIVTALWAIFIREALIAFPTLQISRWWVTAISAGVYIVAFWLGDFALGKSWKSTSKFQQARASHLKKNDLPQR